MVGSEHIFFNASLGEKLKEGSTKWRLTDGMKSELQEEARRGSDIMCGVEDYQREVSDRSRALVVLVFPCSLE